MHVKIVLRDKESGLYYRNARQWVKNPYEALTFRNILEAEEFCRNELLDHLQIIQQSGYFPRPLRYEAGKARMDWQARTGEGRPASPRSPL